MIEALGFWKRALVLNTSDVDPDWSYPDPQNLSNPDPGRIQVNTISRFLKHLKIFKLKKKR